ncbi:MAG: hypothetical protein KatS3mg008_2095 [Acidimicrobiales bacterium]|nr:MAG: hypothetical protein KatS3mg008_2095 [Acidimicrobiales bacterium]
MSGAVLTAAVVGATAALVGLVLRRRGSQDAGLDLHGVPVHLEPADLGLSPSEWALVVFTDSECASCASTVRSAREKTAGRVALVEVDYRIRPDLHEKYRVDAVPMLLLVADDGTVDSWFVGPPTDHDLAEMVDRVPASEPVTPPPAVTE